jgi:hypothetical protein
MDLTHNSKNMAARFVKLVVIATLLIASRSGAPAAAISGVYALQDPGRPFAPEVVDNPNVDGLALRYRWQWLEPREGVYDWSGPDSEIARAASRGKKISISMMPGWGTPDWVYQAGATRYNYMFSPGGPMMGCRQLTIPVPWDPVFMAKWGSFLRAAGARYNANPAVVSVKVLGINGNTPEMILPHAGPWSKCPDADELSNWQKAGYTRARLIQTWQAIANLWSSAFPSKGLVLELVPGGMPPIDDNGHLIARANQNGDVTATQQILMLAVRTLGAQLIVQNDGLSGFWNWEAIPQLQQRGVTTGYQMLWSATGDRQCRMNRGQQPCDPAAALNAAVNRGIASGARYLEIYPIDIRNPALQGVIADAHRRLTCGGGSNSQVMWSPFGE